VELGPAARFGPVSDADLPIDVRQVKLHGLLRDPQHLGQLGIRVTLGNQIQDLELATSEVMRLIAQPRVDRRSGSGRAGEVDGMMKSLSDRGSQVIRVRGLHDVGRCAASECGVDEFRVGRSRQHDDFRLKALERLAQPGETVFLVASDSDLRNDEIGIKPLDQRLRFLQRRRFPLDANRASDGVLDRLEPERMRVDQDSGTDFVELAQNDPLAVGD
jgi:hypothetical protein